MAVFKKKGKPKESIVDTVGDTKPVYAVMTASAPVDPSTKMMAKAIERAMSAAVTKSLVSGMDIVDDAKGIKDAMMHERERIKAAWPHMSEAQRKQAAGET